MHLPNHHSPTGHVRHFSVQSGIHPARRHGCPVMTPASNSPARMDFRLQAEQKSLIEQAAALSGQTLSQFGITAMLQAARASIEQATVTELSNRDRDVFLAMLDADVEPNAALRAAAERFGTLGG